MGTHDELLDPKLDIVFWMLFGAERNRELLISLLNAVLQPARPIVTVEVLRAEVDKFSVDDKGIALDVRARFAGGEQADVEMQSQRRPAVRERGLYYWSRLYGGQLTRGAPYTELRRCFVVIITTFNELSAPRFHSTFGIRELKTGERLTDHLELHLVELPKLQKAMEGNDEPDLLAWGRFLAASSREEREAVAAMSPVLRRAQEALERLSADPEARARAEMREMALISHDLDLTRARRDAEAEGRAIGLAEGKAKGLAEGKAEGLAEGKRRGKATLLQRLLEHRFGSLSDEVVRRIASASETDLDAWTLRVLAATELSDVIATPTL